ncbi:MAG: hypothetical protein K6357_03135 [Elusimicrobiota bacterium]
MKGIFESIKGFIVKWYDRFKKFCYLFAIWAVIHSTISICNFSAAFEYDDGIVYSRDAYQKAIEAGDDFNSRLNLYSDYERTKIIPFLTMFFLKIFGFKIDIIADRPDINSSGIIKKWKEISSSIYFVSDQNQKYEILESKKYILFFANSDEGITQAKKAGISAIRIKRNPKSINKLSYTPGKFNEIILPLSEY